MIPRFVHEGARSRVLFGSGTIPELRTQLEKLAIRRALLVSTPSGRDTERIAELLTDRLADTASVATAPLRVETVDLVVDAMRRTHAEGLISVGGGTAIGLAKAAAMSTECPHVAIPTTYAGSEVTDSVGITAAGIRTLHKNLKARPTVVIYDADLTLSLPARFSVLSGFNALTHAVEALRAPDASPLVTLAASEAIATMITALSAIAVAPTNLEARAQALRAAWLSGLCLSWSGTGFQHRLCHVLVSLYALPHAATHAALLPSVVAHFQGRSSIADARLNKALRVSDSAASIRSLAHTLGVEVRLRSLGVPAEAQGSVPEHFPQPMRADVAAILRRAWEMS